MRVIEWTKDKVLLLIGWFKITVFKMAASDKMVSDAEYDRVLADRLQEELDRYRQEHEYQQAEIEGYKVRLHEIRRSVREMARMLIKSGAPYETIYTLVAPGLDSNGWKRLDIAKKLIPENIYTFFYAEDNMGKFEIMEGDELLYWLELTKFGELEHYFQGSYEVVSSHRIKTEEKSYADYRKRLHRLVLEELLVEKKAIGADTTRQAS